MALLLLAVCLAFFLGGAEDATSWTSSSSSCRNTACEPTGRSLQCWGVGGP